MRGRRSEQGFTLVELVVSMLIIAVLVAIAVPSFMGNRNQAKDTEAKSEVRQALPAVKAYLVDGGTPAAVAANVAEYMPSVRVDAAGVAGVAFLVSADDAVCMFRVSDTGNVFGIREPARQNEVTLFAQLASLPASCPIDADTAAAGFTLTSAW